MLLKVEGLSKSYGGINVLSSVDISVDRGEIVGLIGPNGAGKTTLFNCISGYCRPDKGKIYIDGRMMKNKRGHEFCRMGMARTFQASKPFFGMTVLENVALAAYSVTEKEEEAITLAEEILCETGLTGKRDMDVSDLDSGQTRSLELAKALAVKPRILLLDEIMAGLSVKEMGMMTDVIKKTASSGVGVLMVEHIIPAVTALCQRIYVLDGGIIIKEGAAMEVLSGDEVKRAYLGDGYA